MSVWGERLRGEAKLVEDQQIAIRLERLANDIDGLASTIESLRAEVAAAWANFKFVEAERDRLAAELKAARKDARTANRLLTSTTLGRKNALMERDRLAEVRASAEAPFIDWLVRVLHYPFDMSFDTPPPVDHAALARHWNEVDGWNVTDEEASDLVHAEAGIPYREGADRDQPQSSMD